MDSWKEVRPESITVDSSSWPRDDGRFRFGVTGDAAYGGRDGYETEAAFVNAEAQGMASEVPDQTTWYEDIVVGLTPQQGLVLMRQLAGWLSDLREHLPEPPKGFEDAQLVEPFVWAQDGEED